MNIRALRSTDIPILREMAAKSGFPYPAFDSPLVESIQVAVDENDHPIAAVVAERLVQVYLLVSDEHPATKVSAIRALHGAVGAELKAKGYDSAEAFLPPSIAERFGRRLMRTFGWTRNWPSFNHRT